MRGNADHDYLARLESGDLTYMADWSTTVVVAEAVTGGGYRVITKKGSLVFLGEDEALMGAAKLRHPNARAWS